MQARALKLLEVLPSSLDFLASSLDSQMTMTISLREKNETLARNEIIMDIGEI